MTGEYVCVSIHNICRHLRMMMCVCVCMCVYTGAQVHVIARDCLRLGQCCAFIRNSNRLRLKHVVTHQSVGENRFIFLPQMC